MIFKSRISDHDLVDIFRKQKLSKPKARTIEFRSLTNLDQAGTAATSLIMLMMSGLIRRACTNKYLTTMRLCNKHVYGTITCHGLFHLFKDRFD